MRLHFLLFALLALALCHGTGTWAQVPAYLQEPGEYLIYSTIIDSWYAPDSPELPVIKDHTVFHASDNVIRQELSFVASKIPALDIETASDFVGKNLASYPLEQFMLQRTSYRFITDPELIDLFKYGEEGWKRFYARYPQAKGIIAFSRVGFDIAHTRALVAIAQTWDRLSGIGTYVFLEKQSDGAWKITDTLRVWNSWIIELQEP